MSDAEQIPTDDVPSYEEDYWESLERQANR